MIWDIWIKILHCNKYHSHDNMHTMQSLQCIHQQEHIAHNWVRIKRRMKKKVQKAVWVFLKILFWLTFTPLKYGTYITLQKKSQCVLYLTYKKNTLQLPNIIFGIKVWFTTPHKIGGVFCLRVTRAFRRFCRGLKQLICIIFMTCGCISSWYIGQIVMQYKTILA